MDTNYAEAIMILNSDVDDAIRHAEEAGLTVAEIAVELRRKATEVEAG